MKRIKAACLEQTLHFQLREELGSADPYSIVLPCLISSAATVVISVIVCKLLERRA